MVAITPDMVGDALQEAARLWAMNYKLVLRDVRFPQLPSAGNDPLFMGFAWLNFGVNTSKTCYPEALAGQLVKKWAVPLFVIGEAQKFFKTYVDGIIDKRNTELIGQFTRLRDYYSDEVDRQAAAFYRTPYYQQALDQVHAFVKNRSFTTLDRAKGYAYELIVNSDLIDVRQEEIRPVVENGFKVLCEKVFVIYRAWKDRGGDDMYYANTPDEFARNERDPATGRPRAVLGARDYKHVGLRDDFVWILAHAWQMEVRHVSNPWWVAQPDQTYVTNLGVNRARMPVTLSDSWAGQAVDLAAAERRLAALALPQ